MKEGADEQEIMTQGIETMMGTTEAGMDMVEEIKDTDVVVTTKIIKIMEMVEEKEAMEEEIMVATEVIEEIAEEEEEVMEEGIMGTSPCKFLDD